MEELLYNLTIVYERTKTALKLAMGFRGTIANFKFMSKQYGLNEDEF